MPGNPSMHEWQVETQSEVVGEPEKVTDTGFDYTLPVGVSTFIRCKKCNRACNLETLLKGKADRERELDGPCTPKYGKTVEGW